MSQNFIATDSFCRAALRPYKSKLATGSVVSRTFSPSLSCTYLSSLYIFLLHVSLATRPKPLQTLQSLSRPRTRPPLHSSQLRLTQLPCSPTTWSNVMTGTASSAPATRATASRRAAPRHAGSIDSSQSQLVPS
ncbi:hypothetical protein PsYK624_112940 [Phanerochaete sordida]|uniref:Uncharacterized protein n=1 Tax=Phanerochaete sordida TaxID=48140 RepID=A0A9P3GIZ3_9APHY|nr:hypothetical protein PsYK624_112940 [Phanerochaete sordida]